MNVLQGRHWVSANTGPATLPLCTPTLHEASVSHSMCTVSSQDHEPTSKHHPKGRRGSSTSTSGQCVTVVALKSCEMRKTDQFFTFQMINSLAQRDQGKHPLSDSDVSSSGNPPLSIARRVNSHWKTPGRARVHQPCARFNFLRREAMAADTGAKGCLRPHNHHVGHGPALRPSGSGAHTFKK